jgi:hypothetical protein
MPPLPYMQIFILRSTIASGQPLEAGNVYDVSDDDAQVLTRMGRATLELPAPKPTRKVRPDGDH